MSDFLERIITRSLIGPEPDAVLPRPPARFETLDGVALNQPAGGEPEQVSGPAEARPGTPFPMAPLVGSQQDRRDVVGIIVSREEPTGVQPPAEQVEGPAHPALEPASPSPAWSVETPSVQFHEPGPVREQPLQDYQPQPVFREEPVSTILRLERVERILPPVVDGLERAITELSMLPPPAPRVPEVRVSIGRIEVNASPAPPLPARTPAARHAPPGARPVRSLDEYLAERQEGGTHVPRRR